MHGQAGWDFWFIGFALTVVLEAPWILAGLRAFETNRTRRVLALLFANLLTHPLVWYLFPSMPLPRSVSLAASELWAFAGECIFYASFIPSLTHRRAALLSFAANGTSFAIGRLIVHHFGAALFRW
jgi:hypothetical protein